MKPVMFDVERCVKQVKVFETITKQNFTTCRLPDSSSDQGSRSRSMLDNAGKDSFTIIIDGYEKR
eukprot:1191608-Prorocentrum_minimum.AAC.3